MNYRRELRLDDVSMVVCYEQNGISYRRDLFVSYPDQVFVMRLKADCPRSLDFKCRLTRPELFATRAEGDQLVMYGTLSNGKGGDGLNYIARLKALAKGGEVVCTDSALYVKNADEVVLLLAASTDYKLEYPHYRGRDCVNLTRRRIDKAARKTYEQLYLSHKADSQYYDRVELELDSSLDTISTDRMVAAAQQGCVSGHLYELMFQYGRYLLISSSRPGTLPANLQGIWANKIQTPWNGDYHTDINIQMNYWLANVTNLSEMHQPMFDMLASLVQPGSRTARVQYNKKGWVTHTIMNPWGFTSPGERVSWGMYPGAAAWISLHIGEYYRFTGDKRFLKEMYPVLKGAVEFYMDWLSVHPQSGKLVSGPAISPENTFISPDGIRCQLSMGPNHDQQVIWQLFDDFIRISEILRVDSDFACKVEASQKKIGLYGNRN